MVVGVALLEAEVAVEADVTVEALHAHTLHKVEDVDEVGRVDVPALDEDDVGEHVELVDGVQTVVEHDSGKRGRGKK